MVTGKPTAKMFSWGAMRASTPMEMLAISKAVISGSASIRPVMNITEDQASMVRKPAAANGVALIGSSSKLSASTENISRWPFMARNISVMIRPRKALSTEDWALLRGSKKDAKDRPICRPMVSPATSMAVNMMRKVMPKAVPMRICWPSTAMPCQEPGGMISMGGSAGTMAMLMAMPKISRVRRGMPALLKTGAAASMASMRASG